MLWLMSTCSMLLAHRPSATGVSGTNVLGCLQSLSVFGHPPRPSPRCPPEDRGRQVMSKMLSTRCLLHMHVSFASKQVAICKV